MSIEMTVVKNVKMRNQSATRTMMANRQNSCRSEKAHAHRDQQLSTPEGRPKAQKATHLDDAGGLTEDGPDEGEDEDVGQRRERDLRAGVGEALAEALAHRHVHGCRDDGLGLAEKERGGGRESVTGDARGKAQQRGRRTTWTMFSTPTTVMTNGRRNQGTPSSFQPSMTHRLPEHVCRAGARQRRGLSAPRAGRAKEGQSSGDARYSRRARRRR